MQTLKNTLVFTMALVIAGIIDSFLARPLFPFGGIVGGILIGLLLRKKVVLHALIIGMFYISAIFVMVSAMWLDGKDISSNFWPMISFLGASFFLKLFSVILFFVFGSLIGRLIMKKKI